MIFFWPHVSHLCNIGFETVKKNDFFEIVKWSAIESKKFNAKYVRSTPKFNAKFLKLALNALNLCKIYAKYQRILYQIYAKIQRKIMQD